MFILLNINLELKSAFRIKYLSYRTLLYYWLISSKRIRRWEWCKNGENGEGVSGELAKLEESARLPSPTLSLHLHSMMFYLYKTYVLIILEVYKYRWAPNSSTPKKYSIHIESLKHFVIVLSTGIRTWQVKENYGRIRNLKDESEESIMQFKLHNLGLLVHTVFQQSPFYLFFALLVTGLLVYRLIGLLVNSRNNF